MSNRNKTPLILFGATEDLTGWNKINSPTVTGSQTDPLGGTDAVLIADDAAGAIEYLESDNVTLTPNIDGEAVCHAFLKAGTATSSRLSLYDATAAAVRHTVLVTWSGGVPTLSTDTGAGTLFTPILCGNAWYLIRFSATSIVSGNNHTLRILPTNSTAASTGTVLAYIRSTIVPPMFLDNSIAWPQPREGSEVSKSAAGTEDAWIVATDEFLRGDVRWIPTVDKDTPQTASGWDGRLEAAWANAGWAEFITFGQAKSTFVFVPDVADCTSYHTVYLVEPGPETPMPRLEMTDLTRALTLILRDSSSVPFEGY